jgi:DNA-binding NarL/FixJ family response regulator
LLVGDQLPGSKREASSRSTQPPIDYEGISDPLDHVVVSARHRPGVYLDKVRVVLADDSPHFSDVIRSTLGGSFHVVAAVSDGRQAMIAVLDLDPDLLITDLSMPYLDGLQLARELKKASCRTKIIMLTMHNDPALISAALDAGVSGYVLKARLSLDLVPAVNEVMNGNTFVSDLA